MRILLLVISLLIPALARESTIDPGVARGTLQIGAEKIELKYAAAFEHDNAEGLLDGPEIRVLLADRQVPETLLAGHDGVARAERLAREGKLRGVLLCFDPRSNDDHLSGTLLAQPPDPSSSMLFFSSSGRGELKRWQVASNRVAGEAQYPPEVLEDKDRTELPAFQFSATFSAPLFHDLKVTEDLRGIAAQRSAPAQAVLAFERALGAGDLAAAERLATTERWRQLEVFRSQAGDPAFRRAIRQMIPARDVRVGQLRRVVIRDARAVVLFDVGGSKTAMNAVRVDGVWKVD